MTDAGYYRGTTADQDNRFQDKEKKLMKTLKFSDTLNEPVDMRKVKLDAMKPWINEKLTEILGFEDDVVIDYAINQLESTNLPNAKSIQINLTGFLNAKNARTFMGELWPMLMSAMKNPHGIPDQLIAEKRAEMEKEKSEGEKMKEFQSNIETIKDQLKKDRKSKSPERSMEKRDSRDTRENRDDRKRDDRKRDKKDRRERRTSRERTRRSRSRERKRSRSPRERKHRRSSRSKERKQRRSRSRDRKRESKRERRREAKSRSPPPPAPASSSSAPKEEQEEKRREKSKSKSRERDDKRAEEKAASPASIGSDKME